MNTFTKKEQIVVLSIILIIILTVGFKFVIGDIIEAREKNLEVESTIDGLHNIDTQDMIIEEDNNSRIMVHISGQVYFPGIVELEEGKRLIDAVDLAGGLKKDADIDRINLAKKLVDEEKVYIPKIGEDLSNDLAASTIDTTGGSESGKININTCSKSELVSLPGIGDVIADRIIEYRETSSFNRIEDVMNVSGIGEKKFESIKELIRVK